MVVWLTNNEWKRIWKEVVALLNYPIFAWRDRKTTKDLRIVYIIAEIWTKRLPTISLQYYQQTNLLGVTWRITYPARAPASAPKLIVKLFWAARCILIHIFAIGTMSELFMISHFTWTNCCTAVSIDSCYIFCSRVLRTWSWRLQNYLIRKNIFLSHNHISTLQMRNVDTNIEIIYLYLRETVFRLFSCCHSSFTASSRDATVGKNECTDNQQKHGTQNIRTMSEQVLQNFTHLQFEMGPHSLHCAYFYWHSSHYCYCFCYYYYYKSNHTNSCLLQAMFPATKYRS
jgi:hypothetical protein